MQILNTITGKSNGWANHPATKMWVGHEAALWEYMYCMINEWVSRGYKNNIVIARPDQELVLPHWLGEPKLHLSHRSNLLRKNFQWYSQFFPDDPTDLQYIWPTNE